MNELPNKDNDAGIRASSWPFLIIGNTPTKHTSDHNTDMFSDIRDSTLTLELIAREDRRYRE